MQNTQALALSQREISELVRLARVARDGGDVQLAAFTALCPTGEEGAFDEEVCDCYRTLLAAGLVDGEAEGGAFYFNGLTEEGFERGSALDDTQEESGPEDSEGIPDGSVEESFASDGKDADDGASGKRPDRPVSGGLVGVAAAAGFVAGIVGGVAGALLVRVLM